MNHFTGQYKNALIIIIALTSCLYNLKAQIPTVGTHEIEVPVLQKLDSLFAGCYIENAIFDEAEFKRRIMIKECHFPNLRSFEPDFKTESLVGFEVRGDKCVRAGAAVFRDDREKKYKIKIRNISGGCRAGGGNFQGWFTIKKIPSDYNVEFSSIKVIGELSGDEKDASPNSLIIKKPAVKPESLKSIPYRMNSCIHIDYPQNWAVIKDKETFNKSIREYLRESCVDKLEKIDFDKYSLLGVEVYTGSCPTPPLKYQTVKDSIKKEYILNISYPTGSLCRALQLDYVWVLVPKIPENYFVKFEIEGVKPVSKRN